MVCVHRHIECSRYVVVGSKTDDLPNRVENGLSGHAKRCTRAETIEASTEQNRIHDAFRGSSVSKMRTQFSISRIGFGLTFRWIRNAHCTIIVFFHRQNDCSVHFFFLFFGCSMLISSVSGVDYVLGVKINDEAMQ